MLYTSALTTAFVEPFAYQSNATPFGYTLRSETQVEYAFGGTCFADTEVIGATESTKPDRNREVMIFLIKLT